MTDNLMRYCQRCGHADILHVDSFIRGRQECDVNGCACDLYAEKVQR